MSKNEINNMIERWDKAIDEAIGICTNGKLEQIQLETSFFEARLLLWSQEELDEYIKKKIDPKLLEALKQSDESTQGHVVEFSPEQIEAVEKDNIIEARAKFLSDGSSGQKMQNE